MRFKHFRKPFYSIKYKNCTWLFAFCKNIFKIFEIILTIPSRTDAFLILLLYIIEGKHKFNNLFFLIVYVLMVLCKFLCSALVFILVLSGVLHHPYYIHVSFTYEGRKVNIP